jgi:hypothetical protein
MGCPIRPVPIKPIRFIKFPQKDSSRVDSKEILISPHNNPLPL